MKKFQLSTKKKSRFVTVLVMCLVVGFITLATILVLRYKSKYPELPSYESLYEAWENEDYKSVYQDTAFILEYKPEAPFWALHGFSAYQLASAQTSETEAQDFIDECIVSLRKALYTLNEKDLPRLYYILGKAYYQKGFFYYDLASKYLDIVFDLGYTFEDLNIFRGMAYSQLGEDEKAIEAFTHALSSDTDEFLLYALAKSYLQVENYDKAKMYLTEASEKSSDVLVKLNCMSLLAQVYLNESAYDKARLEYEDILKIDNSYADAYYGLGLVYERLGDVVKARAEWRNALKANPIHAGAVEKLSMR